MNNVHFAIPEIYGETLSYYELLRKLVDKTNDLIDNYNTVPEQIADAVANLDASQLFSTVLNQLIHSIATDNTKSANAVKVYKKHELLYATFNETVDLYESLIDFSTGTATELIPGTNIREVNISELFIELRKLIGINKNNIESVRAVANENSAEITTIRNDITSIENKNTEQDNEITTLRTMISSPYNFKGDVASISALPASGNINDTYYVQDVKYKVTWTGSAWVQSSLNEADYQTELSELKSDLSEVNALMADIFDKNILLKNVGYIGSNGVVQHSENAKYTDYEDISNYDTLTYVTGISEAALELAFYDANKNLLSDISVLGSFATTERTIDLTDAKYSNAKYVILSCYGEGNFTRFYCIASKNNLNNRVVCLNNRLVYLEHNAVTEDEIISYTPENGNQFNKDTVKVGYEVYNDGRIVVQGESAVSDYIYVKGHREIYITNLPVYEGARYCAFYDENKTFISLGNGVSNKISKGVVTIPNGACYFVTCLYQRWKSGSKDYDNVMISFSGYKEYEPFIECIGKINGLQIPKTETTTSTKDKKMIIFGDSITETATMNDDGTNYKEGTRTNWMTFAKGYLQIGDFKNYAKSGATYKDRSNASFRQQLSDQINLAMADSNNDGAEIVVVSLGTNDGTTSFGDYETAMSKTSLDELDRTKLYEAIRWAMWTLRTKYEDATFFVALPIQRASGEQPVVLLNAITEMAHRYNFIIIDAQNESGIVRDFEISGAKGRYLYDGLHPNAEGAEKMAKLYSNVILRNFIAN